MIDQELILIVDWNVRLFSLHIQANVSESCAPHLYSIVLEKFGQLAKNFCMWKWFTATPGKNCPYAYGLTDDWLTDWLTD